MLADLTQHQFFVRLSAVVPTDTKLLFNEFILYFGFLIGSSCQADNYKIPAQQQAVNVVRNLCNLLSKLVSEK